MPRPLPQASSDHESSRSPAEPLVSSGTRGRHHMHSEPHASLHLCVAGFQSVSVIARPVHPTLPAAVAVHACVFRGIPE